MCITLRSFGDKTWRDTACCHVFGIFYGLAKQTACGYLRKKNKKIKLFLCGLEFLPHATKCLGHSNWSFVFFISFFMHSFVMCYKGQRLKPHLRFCLWQRCLAEWHRIFASFTAATFNIASKYFFEKGPKPEVKTNQLHTTAQLQWFEIT